jgi:hypothetical protein
MLEQRSQLAGILLCRHNQFSLKFCRSGTQLLDILARIGMVIGVDDFIKNLESYLLDEGMKRSSMGHTTTEQRGLSLGPGERL